MRIFGHRGACGYLPENTLEAMRLAVDQGVDGIEFDVIPSADAVLVVRHENELSLTTDVANRVEFASRQRLGFADGREMTGWFAEDFSAVELATLRTRERFPEFRAKSAEHDGLYHVPTMHEVLTDSKLARTPLIIEVKHGRYFAGIGLDPVGMVAAGLEAVAWRDSGREIIVESFNFEVLMRLRDAIGRPASFVFLTDKWRAPSDSDALADYWRRASTEFDGVAVDLELLDRPGLVAELKAMGLKVFGYTARVEQAERSGQPVADYHRELFDLQPDAIFSDQPDQLRRDVAALL